MDRHIRCYRADNGELIVISSCPCACHDPYDTGNPPRVRDWGQHNGFHCESWVNAQFTLESRQVDIYRRTGRPAGESLTLEQLALVGEQPSKLDRDRRRWHQLTGREPSW